MWQRLVPTGECYWRASSPEGDGGVYAVDPTVQMFRVELDRGLAMDLQTWW